MRALLLALSAQVITTVLVAATGGPVWASAGLGFLAFLAVREGPS